MRNDNGLFTTVVIFGASGDLTRRKLVPGLYSLYRKGALPADFAVVGTSRSGIGHEAFREEMRGGVDEFVVGGSDDAVWARFAAKLYYVAGDATEADSYQGLNAFLQELEGGEANRLYYLSTAPRFFDTIVLQLGGAGMVQEKVEESWWRRVVIEKPFGRDLASAQALNQSVHTVLAEHQIYRIDHYLAKETVQNILAFRFANTMFEPIWNRNYVDHVQITVAEAVDVGHRAGYYDQAGVLRDMFQNHLMQLLALVAMEPPAFFEAEAVRDEKVKTMRAVRAWGEGDLARRTVRAQYEGYRVAEGVAEGSETPTYAALELYIDNWRWQGVPFYLRSGKGLQKKATEIIVQFKRPPHMMFAHEVEPALRSNYLAFCIQPHEGVHQRFEMKVPGPDFEIRSVDMDFHYDELFAKESVPEAYETLLLNALEGDATLFTRSDGIEAAWRVIDPIIQGWETAAAPPLGQYVLGSWGPHEADELLGKGGRFWRHGCVDEED